MILRATPGAIEIINTPQSIPDLVRMMGVRAIRILHKTFRVGGPWGVEFCVLTPGPEFHLPAHRVIGPVTLRGTCLLGRYTPMYPHLSDISVSDIRRLGL